MPDNLVTCRSAYSLQVERETSMTQHAVVCSSSPLPLPSSVELGVVGVAEQIALLAILNPNFLSRYC